MQVVEAAAAGQWHLRSANHVDLCAAGQSVENLAHSDPYSHHLVPPDHSGIPFPSLAALGALAALLPWVNSQVSAAMAASLGTSTSAPSDGCVQVLTIESAQTLVGGCVAVCLKMLDFRVTPPPASVSNAAVRFLQV